MIRVVPGLGAEAGGGRGGRGCVKGVVGRGRREGRRVGGRVGWLVCRTEGEGQEGADLWWKRCENATLS